MIKNKILFPGILVLFVLINTSYYWDGMLGGWNVLLLFAYILTFLILFIALLIQLFRIVRDRFKNRSVTRSTAFAVLLLLLIIWRPRGIIDFESLETKDVLIAFQEGSANCTTTLKLKANKTFYIRSICFGIDKKGGTYALNRDTVKFNFSSREPQYAFAVFKKVKGNGNNYDLYLYRSVVDTSPYPLAIEKNLLFK